MGDFQISGTEQWKTGSEKHIIFAGDFNLFIDHSLDAKGVSPSLKKKLSKWITWN